MASSRTFSSVRKVVEHDHGESVELLDSTVSPPLSARRGASNTKDASTQTLHPFVTNSPSPVLQNRVKVRHEDNVKQVQNLQGILRPRNNLPGGGNKTGNQKISVKKQLTFDGIDVAVSRANADKENDYPPLPPSRPADETNDLTRCARPPPNDTAYDDACDETIDFLSKWIETKATEPFDAVSCVHFNHSQYDTM